MLPRPSLFASLQAALARAPVVGTNNLADFEATGVALLNPWQRD